MPLKRSAKSKAKAKFSSCLEMSDDGDEVYTCISKKPRDLNQDDIQIAQISDIKSMAGDILQVNHILSLPLGVVELVRDAFMCNICHNTPMKPQVISTKCCNSMLGCRNVLISGTMGLKVQVRSADIAMSQERMPLHFTVKAWNFWL